VAASVFHCESLSLGKVPFSAYTFKRLLWMVGSVIAAAGMQVYIIWGSVRREPIQNHNPSDLSFRPYLTTAGRRTTSNISFPDPSNSSHLYTPRTQYSLVCLIFQLQFPSLLIDLAYGAANFSFLLNTLSHPLGQLLPHRMPYFLLSVSLPWSALPGFSYYTVCIFLLEFGYRTCWDS
jgi:hypothetical protein